MINIEKVKPTGLFTNYIYKAIPLAFDESMSYYETLCGLLSYLKDTIMPALNNNADALIEVQNLITQLQNYVENYFENLDVQEEINNKLDEMAENGTLAEIIEDYASIPELTERIEEVNTNLMQQINDTNNNLNNLELQVNNTIDDNMEDITNTLNDFNSRINTLGNITPTIVDSTDEMTDETKLYILSSSGEWYYYNGTNFVSGGTYQSTAIGNNSIDLLSLDDLLQANFNVSFSDDITLENGITGYCSPNSNNEVNITLQSNYMYYKVPLEVGKIYMFNGANSQVMCGLLVADSNDKILYNTNIPQATTQHVGTSLMFKVNQSGCYAYISTRTNFPTRYIYNQGTRLRTINNISNNLKTDSNVDLLDTINNYYMSYGGVLQSASGYNVKVYSIEKGKKYHATSKNILSVAGIMVISGSWQVLYTSSESSVGSTPIDTSYTFTATTNGYLILQDNGNWTSSVEVIIDAINDTSSNKLKYLKIGADGDSISAGVSGNSSYITQIATQFECQLQNLSVGGGTIATGTTQNGQPRHHICTSVNNLDNNCDIILLSGGVNDYWQKVPMGEITDDYTSPVDSNTFYGGLETMCRNVLNKFRTQKIAFVTYHKIGNIYYLYNSSTGEKHTFKEYLDAIYEVMNKYSIPVIDINSKARFNTAIDYYKDTYTTSSDGVHPTTNGYAEFYNKIIINELNNLL